MNRHTEYDLQRGEDVFTLDVEYKTSRYYPAITYGLPEDCEPSSGGEIEEMAITLDGKEFGLTDDELSELETWLYENTDYSEG